MATPTKDEWKNRIAPHLSTSLQTVSEQITQAEAVQSWLHKASGAAAEGLGQMSGMQGEMMGYMRMMNELEDAMPALLAAVDELTAGTGEIDLHWKPLRPSFSQLYISFDRDYTVELFVCLAQCTQEAAQTALDTVAAALPGGDPFPHRPNKTTGLVARNSHAVGVRVTERLREDGAGTTRSVTLLSPNRQPRERLSTPDAVRGLRQLLCSDASDA